MLDPPGCAADVWYQIGELIIRGAGHERNFYRIAIGGDGDLKRNGVLTTKGRRRKANKKLTGWCHETRGHLGPFKKEYAGLSHRLLTFYKELKRMARNIANFSPRIKWKYGYILIVRTDFAS